MIENAARPIASATSTTYINHKSMMQWSRSMFVAFDDRRWCIPWVALQWRPHFAAAVPLCLPAPNAPTPASSTCTRGVEETRSFCATDRTAAECNLVDVKSASVVVVEQMHPATGDCVVDGSGNFLFFGAFEFKRSRSESVCLLPPSVANDPSQERYVQMWFLRTDWRSKNKLNTQHDALAPVRSRWVYNFP